MAAKNNPSMQETVEKELECAICLGIFYQPRLLNCMHTFCGKCLLPLFQRQPRGYTIVCPTCRDVTEIKNPRCDLPTNFIAQNIIEQMKNVNITPSCHDCVDQSPAKMHCNNCKLNLCEDCTKYHQKSIKFVGHKIVEVSQTSETISKVKLSRYCDKHKELLKYFCENCNVLVCNDCMISKMHRNHAFGLMDEVKEKMKNEIQTIVDKGRKALEILESTIKEADSFNEECKASKQRAISTVNTVFDDLEKQLQQQKKQILDQVMSAGDTETISLEEAGKKARNLSNLIKYSTSISNIECGFQAVKVFVDTKQKLQGLYKEIGVDQIKLSGVSHYNDMDEAYKNNQINSTGWYRSRNNKLGSSQSNSGYQRNGINTFFFTTSLFQRQVGNISINLSNLTLNVDNILKTATNNTISKNLTLKKN